MSTISKILPRCERDQNICDFTRRIIKAASMPCILQQQTYIIFNCFSLLCSPGHSVLYLPSASFPSHTTWTHYFYLCHSSQQTFFSRHFLLMIPKTSPALLFILLPLSMCTFMCVFLCPLHSQHITI